MINHHHNRQRGIFPAVLLFIIACSSDDNTDFHPVYRRSGSIFRFDETIVIQEKKFSLSIPKYAFQSNTEFNYGTVSPNSVPGLPSGHKLIEVFYLGTVGQKRPLTPLTLHLKKTTSKSNRSLGLFFFNPHFKGYNQGQWQILAETGADKLDYEIFRLSPSPLSFQNNGNEEIDAPVVFAVSEKKGTADLSDDYCTSAKDNEQLCRYFRQTLPNQLGAEILETDKNEETGLGSKIRNAISETLPLSFHYLDDGNTAPIYRPYSFGISYATPALLLPSFNQDFPVLDGRGSLNWEYSNIYERQYAAYILQLLLDSRFVDLWRGIKTSHYLWGDDLPTIEQGFYEDFIDFLSFHLLIAQNFPLKEFVMKRIEVSSIRKIRNSDVSLLESARNSKDFRKVKGIGLLILQDLVDDSPSEDPYPGSLIELLYLIENQKPIDILDLFFSYVRAHNRYTISPYSRERKNWLQQVYYQNSLVWNQQVIIEDKQRKRRSHIHLTLYSGRDGEGGPESIFLSGPFPSDDFKVFSIPIPLGDVTLIARDTNGKILGTCTIEIDLDWARTHETSTFREILYISPCFASCRPSIEEISTITSCD